MLHRFANSELARTFERDDVLQELRTSLFIAQQKYDAERGIAFSSYLWNTLHNTLLRMRYRQRDLSFGHRAVNASTVSLDALLEQGVDVDDARSTEVELFEVLGNGVSENALRVARAIVEGNAITRRDFARVNISPNEVRAAKRELRSIFNRGGVTNA